MLSDLPIEILEQIISHLPTASSVTSLSIANRALYKKLSSNDYAIFRAFVQNSFPSFIAAPLWRDAAYVLTSRSRAWDRRAFIARECIQPRDEWTSRRFTAGPQPKFGSVPIIDSYATWTGPTWSDGKEVIAWSDWGRLRTRVTKNGNVIYSSWRTVDDQLAENDILDVRILRPPQNTNSEGESYLLRKANRQIVKLESRPAPNVFEQVSRYATQSDHVDCMDITSSASPVLAVCNTKSISLYPVNTDSSTVQPSDTCQLDQPFILKHRKRCAKFLSDTTLAVAMQFVEDRQRSPISIYDINSTGLNKTPLAAMHSMGASTSDQPQGRHCANTIVNLDATASLVSRPGKVFLSGWSDGIARLHDLRDPSTSRAEYIDVVDDGQILCLLPIGHERFLAGSHQNACLKVFDLRMTGGRVYDYLKASPQQSASTPRKPPTQPQPTTRSPQRDINIFLAVHLPKSRNTGWSPLPTPTPHHSFISSSTHSLPRYRGSIYSLSSPSPLSPTIYAGIENHVISVSVVSTDDALSPSNLSTTSPKFPTLLPSITSGLGAGMGDILSLSCYERPRPGHASTDVVLLRKQLNWHEVAKPSGNTTTVPEEGWDERWRLAMYERPERRGGRGRWSRAP